MRKRDELSNTSSCLNKAGDDELLFVLLGRDASSIDAVNAWIESRIRRGKNKPDDPKIISARQWVADAIRELLQAGEIRPGMEGLAAATVDAMDAVVAAMREQGGK